MNIILNFSYSATFWYYPKIILLMGGPLATRRYELFHGLRAFTSKTYSVHGPVKSQIPEGKGEHGRPKKRGLEYQDFNNRINIVCVMTLENFIQKYSYHKSLTRF